jgi:hypothetical protein
MLKPQHLKGRIFALAAFFCCALSAQQQLPLVAVVNPVVKANNVPTAVQGFVRGKMEELVLNTKKYRVVDRTRIDQVTAEHTFTRNGLVDNNLVKDIGKLMQADIVCVSTIEKEPGLTVVNCSLVDVESGEVFGSSSEMVESDSVAAIRDCAEKAGRKMLRLEDSGFVQAANELAEQRRLEEERREQQAREQQARNLRAAEQAKREREAREREALDEAAMERARMEARNSGAPTQESIQIAKRTINRLFPQFENVKISGNNISARSKIFADYEKYRREGITGQTTSYSYYVLTAEIVKGKLQASSSWNYLGAAYSTLHNTVKIDANGISASAQVSPSIKRETSAWRASNTPYGATTEFGKIIDPDAILFAIADAKTGAVGVSLIGSRTVNLDLNETLKMAISQTIELYDAANLLKRAGVRIQQSYKL